MQNFDVVNRLMQQTASPALPEQAIAQAEPVGQTMAQPNGAKALWQVTHAG
jgi:hypothetical protein